jgi:hypothetical protein
MTSDGSIQIPITLWTQHYCRYTAIRYSACEQSLKKCLLTPLENLLQKGFFFHIQGEHSNFERYVPIKKNCDRTILKN